MSAKDPPVQKLTAEETARINAQTDEIERFEKEHGLHPIFHELAFAILEGDGTQWPHDLPEGMQAEIKEWLEAARVDGSLPLAVFTLIRLSVFLDHEVKVQGKLPYQILSIANDAVIHYDLLKNMNVTDTAATARDAKLRSATGAQERATPAKVGDKAPEGSVKGGAFVLPRRRI